MTLSATPMQKDQNDQPMIDQHTIGKYIISYNPDDNRFHVSTIDNIYSIATFANNKAGYANMLYWIRKR